MNDRFDVIFEGKIDNDVTRNEVKRNFQTTLKASEKQIERLFSGKPAFLKRNISKKQANAICAKIRNIGAIAHISPSITDDRFSTNDPNSRVNQKNNIQLPSKYSLVEKEQLAQVSPPTIRLQNQESLTQTTHIGTNTNDSQPETPRYQVSNKKTKSISMQDVLNARTCTLALGLALLFNFFPGEDGDIKRGAIIGLLFIFTGGYKILKQRGSL